MLKVTALSFLLIFLFGCSSNNQTREESIIGGMPFESSSEPAYDEIYPAIAPVSSAPEPGVRGEAAANIDTETNTHILLRLQELLHQFLNGEIDLSEQDLIEIEAAVERHRN